MSHKRAAALALALIAAPALAFIQPLTINFQGKLINPSTNNPQTGTVNLTFNMYNVQSGGSSLWTETQNNVALNNGVFAVELGTYTALPRDLFLGASVYLGVTVVGDAGGEMSPRQRLVMSPYAFSANQLSDNTEVRMIAGPTYSTFTSAGNLSVPSGVSGSSGSFTNGVTASSGTFLNTSGYSIVTSSGINVTGVNTVVYAPYFSGSFVGNGAGLTGVAGALSGGSSGYLPKWSGATSQGLSSFWETASSDTALGGLAAAGGTFSVGGSSFSVAGGSATVAYGLTAGSVSASSAVFSGVSAAGYGLTVSSGLQVNQGTLDVNGGGGIVNSYAIYSASGVFSNAVGVGVTSLNAGGTLVVQSTNATASYGILRAYNNGGNELLRLQQDGTFFHGGPGRVSTFTSLGDLKIPYGLYAASATLTSGITASSGTFTATGTSYSIVASSGINVTGVNTVVYAPYFSGSFVGNGAGLTGVAGALSGGSSGYLPKWSGATSQGLSSFWETASSDTALGGLAAAGGTFSVGVSSFSVAGGSATVGYGLTAGSISASSATFSLSSPTAAGLTVSSGLVVQQGTLDVNGAGGITNAYGLWTGSATISTFLTASSATFSAVGGYGLTVSSGIELQNGTLDVNGGGGITNSYALYSASGVFSNAIGIGVTNLSAGGTLVVQSTNSTASYGILRAYNNGGNELLRLQQDGAFFEGGPGRVSSFTATGDLKIPYGLYAASATLTSGITASSGTFTGTGTTYSITTSSGINMQTGLLTLGYSVNNFTVTSSTWNAVCACPVNSVVITGGCYQVNSGANTVLATYPSTNTASGLWGPTQPSIATTGNSHSWACRWSAATTTYQCSVICGRLN